MRLFKRKRTGKAAVIAHVLTALVIIVHGYEKMEKGEGSFWIFFVMGFLFLMIVVFHKFLSLRIKWVESFFHIIEALVLFTIAYDYFHHGKFALPACYLLAATGHVIAAFIKGRKSIKNSPAH
jgi:hypothetical protein